MDTRLDRPTALWAPTWFSLGTQLLVGVMTLGIGWTHLSFIHVDDLAFMGAVGLFVSGSAFGGFLSLFIQRRMVRRHMAADHPGAPVPDRPGR